MAAKIFCCYAHEDEALLDKLRAHLRPLQQNGLIELWHDRDISAGAEWDREISEHLNAAQIILLLVSPDFMNSDYCYGVEMKRALERHDAKEARVIPIILRHVYWQIDPLRKLQALPTDGKPITDPYWHSLDIAFLDVVKGIRKVVIELSKTPASPEERKETQRADAHVISQGNAADVPFFPNPRAEEAEWTRRVEEERQRGVEEERARQAEQAPMASPVSHPAASAFRHLTPTVTHATRKGLRLLLAKPLVLAVTLIVLVSAGAGIEFFVVPRLSSHPAGSAPARLTYRGHTSDVYAVAWSPDGKRIASASADQTVQVWDASTGARLLVYRGHTDQVYTVAWSPDGKRLASGSADGTVQMWDATTGEKVLTHTGFSAAFATYQNDLAWSPNGEQIASPGTNHTVQVWNAATGSNIFTYTGHSGDVEAVAWSPDGQRLASGSADGTVQVWDASTGANAFVYTVPGGSAPALAWSPDGKRLAWGGYGGMQVLDPSTASGKVLTVFMDTGFVNTLAWSPDGRLIASGSEDGTVQVWDASTGTKLFTYTGHTARVHAVAWSPDGKRLASGSEDGTVQVWSVG